MTEKNRNICLTLPNNITKQISTHENNEQHIINFLQNALPSSDIGSIADELRKSLILAKHRSKWDKKKKMQRKIIN